MLDLVSRVDMDAILITDHEKNPFDFGLYDFLNCLIYFNNALVIIFFHHLQSQSTASFTFSTDGTAIDLKVGHCSDFYFLNFKRGVKSNIITYTTASFKMLGFIFRGKMIR